MAGRCARRGACRAWYPPPTLRRRAAWPPQRQRRGALGSRPALGPSLRAGAGACSGGWSAASPSRRPLPTQAPASCTGRTRTTHRAAARCRWRPARLWTRASERCVPVPCSRDRTPHSPSSLSPLQESEGWTRVHTRAGASGLVPSTCLCAVPAVTPGASTRGTATPRSAVTTLTPESANSSRRRGGTNFARVIAPCPGHGSGEVALRDGDEVQVLESVRACLWVVLRAPHSVHTCPRTHTARRRVDAGAVSVLGGGGFDARLLPGPASAAPCAQQRQTGGLRRAVPAARESRSEDEGALCPETAAGTERKRGEWHGRCCTDGASQAAAQWYGARALFVWW